MFACQLNSFTLGGVGLGFAGTAMASQHTGREGLLGDSFEPLNHAEHDAHRDETYGKEDCPADPDGPLVVHERSYPEQEVAYGSCSEPQTLAQSLQMLGRYLRYER